MAPFNRPRRGTARRRTNRADPRKSGKSQKGRVQIGKALSPLLRLYRPLKSTSDSQMLFIRARRKPNKHKHFGWDGVRNKQEPSLGQTGPLPGKNWDPSLGQTSRFLLNSTVRSPFCPLCPWDGCGSSLGRLSRKGHPKNVY